MLNKLKKKQKNEKTNISFIYFKDNLEEKKKNTKKKRNFQIKKKKNIFNGVWDSKRKLFLFFKNIRKTNFIFNMTFLYVEDLLNNLKKNLERKIFFNQKNANFNNWFDIFFRCNWNWFDFLIFFTLKKKGFVIKCFKLFDNRSISPNFFCWKNKNMKQSVISILFFKKTLSFISSNLLLAFIIRLKPGLLKIAIIEKNQLIFFSIDLGFSNLCPIFFNIKLKKKNLKFNF
jgi:hypothetical protein